MKKKQKHEGVPVGSVICASIITQPIVEEKSGSLDMLCRAIAQQYFDHFHILHPHYVFTMPVKDRMDPLILSLLLHRWMGKYVSVRWVEDQAYYGLGRLGAEDQIVFVIPTNAQQN